MAAKELLVRDKTPLLILEEHGSCNIRRAKPNERARLLMKKIIIEATDWLEAKGKDAQEEQMIDVIQVGLDLQKLYELDSDALRDRLLDKQKKKGSYTDFWVLTLPTN